MAPFGENTARHQVSQIAPVAHEFVPQGRGSNWISPALAAVNLVGNGLGVVAIEDVNAGELLVVYGGKIITLEEFDALSDEMQHYPYQVSDELFISPAGIQDIGLGERINHSCNPNAGFRGSIHLIAIRDIRAGEAVTFDYATCVAADDDAFRMECRCGEDNCRKIITGQDWQKKEIQARLFPYFQPFIQDKIRNPKAKPAPLQPPH
jgi:hypothetical protein